MQKQHTILASVNYAAFHYCHLAQFYNKIYGRTNLNKHQSEVKVPRADNREKLQRGCTAIPTLSILIDDATTQQDSII